MNPQSTMEEYVQQIQSMVAKARKWLDEHPGVDAKVQFNFPRNVMMIAEVGRAIKNGVVTANESGKELIAAICEGIDPDKEPTVLMLRLTIENVFEKL